MFSRFHVLVGGVHLRLNLLQWLNQFIRLQLCFGQVNDTFSGETWHIMLWTLIINQIRDDFSNAQTKLEARAWEPTRQHNILVQWMLVNDKRLVFSVLNMDSYWHLKSTYSIQAASFNCWHAGVQKFHMVLDVLTRDFSVCCNQVGWSSCVNFECLSFNQSYKVLQQDATRVNSKLDFAFEIHTWNHEKLFIFPHIRDDQVWRAFVQLIMTGGIWFHAPIVNWNSYRLDFDFQISHRFHHPPANGQHQVAGMEHFVFTCDDNSRSIGCPVCHFSPIVEIDSKGFVCFLNKKLAMGCWWILSTLQHIYEQRLCLQYDQAQQTTWNHSSNEHSDCLSVDGWGIHVGRCVLPVLQLVHVSLVRLRARVARDF